MSDVSDVKSRPGAGTGPAEGDRPAYPAYPGGPSGTTAPTAQTPSIGPAGPAGPGGPIGPFHARWPAPSTPARRRLLLGALVTGTVAALVVPDAGFGLNLFVVALMIAVSVLTALRPRDGESGIPSGSAVTLTTIAVLLSAVAVLRDSEWLVAGCILAALCLAAAVALDARRWDTVLLTGLLFAEAVMRSLPWAFVTVRKHRPRRSPVQAPESVFGGLLLGTFCATVVAMLLASADDTFADLLSGVGDLLTVEAPGTDVVVARVVVLIGVTLFVLGLGFAVSTRLSPAPRPARGRHPAEWMTPLVLVALTIALFLGVEVLAPEGTPSSHAERAREGFGQLIVVTVLVLLLVAWAGRSAAGGHRRMLGSAGGALLLLTLLLAGSALRRLWLYQGEFGWTVTRFNANAFELWVIVLLAAVGVTWLLRRTDRLPRLAIGSAGLGLLGVALAGPDAVVAAANVHRFEQGRGIDTAYLSRLSADAVPALRKLPEPERSCAMPAPTAARPWYGWNLSRTRADGVTPAAPGVCP